MKVRTVSHTDDLDLHVNVASLADHLADEVGDEGLIEEGDVYDAIVERVCCGGDLLDELVHNNPELESFYGASASRLVAELKAAALKKAASDVYELDDDLPDVHFVRDWADGRTSIENLPVMRIPRPNFEANALLDENFDHAEEGVPSSPGFSIQ